MTPSKALAVEYICPRQGDKSAGCTVFLVLSSSKVLGWSAYQSYYRRSASQETQNSRFLWPLSARLPHKPIHLGMVSDGDEALAVSGRGLRFGKQGWTKALAKLQKKRSRTKPGSRRRKRPNRARHGVSQKVQPITQNTLHHAANQDSLLCRASHHGAVCRRFGHSQPQETVPPVPVNESGCGSLGIWPFRSLFSA